MSSLHFLLALLLAVGPCSSESTTAEDDVTSASSGNTFPTITGTDATATEAEQMTRMSESSSATNDEFLTMSSATYHTNEQQSETTTDGATVAQHSNVVSVSGGHVTASESSETTTVATGGTETSVSGEDRDTGSGSITWTTSDSSATADDYRTHDPYNTASLDGTQSEATDATQPTAHVTGNTADDGVTASDVTELNANFSDVTTSQVNTSDVMDSAVTKSHATLSDVSAIIHVNTSDVTSNRSDVTVSDVTMTSESHTSASPVVQDSGAQYSTTDIIIIVVVTVVGGLIIISALVVVVWKFRLYRNFTRYFQSNGHAQEFDMAARASADGKQPIQMESKVGGLAGEGSQVPDSNFTIELVHEPTQHDQPLFSSKADDPLAASGSQFHPAADMVDVPLHDGIRNQGFQGENPNGF